jgi:hypothetical protein
MAGHRRTAGETQTPLVAGFSHKWPGGTAELLQIEEDTSGQTQTLKTLPGVLLRFPEESRHSGLHLLHFTADFRLRRFAESQIMPVRLDSQVCVAPSIGESRLEQ